MEALLGTLIGTLTVLVVGHYIDPLTNWAEKHDLL